MHTAAVSDLLKNLRFTLSAASFAAQRTDAELLGHFISRRDEAAFETLVLRHGSMVFGVCQRVLSHEHDAA